MTVPSELIERVKAHEGFRARVYDDATGRVLRKGQELHGTATIGYGTTIVTEEQGEYLLRSTLEEIQRTLLAKHPWIADQPPAVQGVLVEMVYQLGLNGAWKFKRFLDALYRRDYAAAANEMLGSEWYHQTPHRVEALAKVILEAQA